MFGVLIPKRCAAHKQRLDRPFCSFCAADHPNTATQYWWKEYDPAEGLDQATFFAGGSNWGDIVSRDSSFPYDNICDTCGQETDDVYEHDSSPGEFNCQDCHSEKYPDQDN